MQHSFVATEEQDIRDPAAWLCTRKDSNVTFGCQFALLHSTVKAVQLFSSNENSSSNYFCRTCKSHFRLDPHHFFLRLYELHSSHSSFSSSTCILDNMFFSITLDLTVQKARSMFSYETIHLYQHHRLCQYTFSHLHSKQTYLLP